MHRKSIVRSLKREQIRSRGDTKKRGRKRYYTADVQAALKELWDLLGEPCGELLHPVIEDTVTHLTKDGMWKYGNSTTQKLCGMKGLSSTKHSSMKEIIPVFCGPWSDVDPGEGQIDTVAHCGSTLKGDYVFSLGYTDVATTWRIYRAQWNKGMVATHEGLQSIREWLPWEMKHLHPDCGTEFLNEMVVTWCQQEGIDLSRSRPYHKNDNAYIEQKNGHWVRKELGYRRLDAREVVEVMHRYYDLLMTFRNHFVPQRKAISSIKEGKKSRKRYGQAKTPFRRVLEHTSIPEEVKTYLTKVHDSINLVELKRELGKLKALLFNINERYGTDIR